MTEIRVSAEREGRLWVLRLEDGGVTQARHLGEVEDMVTDYVAVMRGLDPQTIHVTVTAIDPGDGLGEEITAARQAQAKAAEAQEAAAAHLRRTARALRDQGLTGPEIAVVLGVSKQRVSQLTLAHRISA
ncbi:MAG: hypothetical protein QG608_66 [Actinomycetota bacterium]|nr:hypothetical protein [Actinomycetota bacterium]